MRNQNQEDMLARLEPLLTRTPTNQPVVLMTCGLAGSGKSTLAKAVLERLPQYKRLSIDEIIFREHGIYGVDYPRDENLYERYQEEADELYLDEFRNLLRDGADIILERSFYAKEDRDAFRDMIISSGAKCVFVYLKATDKEVLWQRICARSEGERQANSSLDITREIFEMYWRGFEEPKNEDEIVFHVT